MRPPVHKNLEVGRVGNISDFTSTYYVERLINKLTKSRNHSLQFAAELRSTRSMSNHVLPFIFHFHRGTSTIIMDYPNFFAWLFFKSLIMYLPSPHPCPQ